MAVVSSIRALRNIIEISLDGRVFLRLRQKDFAKKPLAQGDHIDEDAYLDAISAMQFKDAYERALTALDFSARTEKEIARALLMKGFTPPAVSAAIARLRENRLIDDGQYARRAVELSANRPIGIYAMKRKLYAKGIAQEDIETALGEMDSSQQLAAAKKAADRIFPKYRALPRREARAKLSQALMRRGFAWDTIQPIVEQIFADDFDESFE